MATGTPDVGTFDGTQAECTCFIAQRQDIQNAVCAASPSTCSQGAVAVCNYWWTSGYVNYPTGTGGDADKKQAAGGVFSVYLQQNYPSCYTASGTASTGSTTPTSTGVSSQAIAWVQANPTIALGALGFALLVAIVK